MQASVLASSEAGVSDSSESSMAGECADARSARISFNNFVVSIIPFSLC